MLYQFLQILLLLKAARAFTSMFSEVNGVNTKGGRLSGDALFVHVCCPSCLSCFALFVGVFMKLGV